MSHSTSAADCARRREFGFLWTLPVHPFVLHEENQPETSVAEVFCLLFEHLWYYPLVEFGLQVQWEWLERVL